jgi:hypothetical protein
MTIQTKLKVNDMGRRYLQNLQCYPELINNSYKSIRRQPNRRMTKDINRQFIDEKTQINILKNAQPH